VRDGCDWLSGRLELRAGGKLVGKTMYKLAANRARTVTVKLKRKLRRRTKVTLRVISAGAPPFNRRLHL
jgi:hypothetical protein